MSDVISLRGLAVEACHGVLPEEKTAPQPFLLDIELSVDLRWAGRSDDLHDTVSYADIAQRAVAAVTADSVDLVETLAARVADVCLAEPYVEAAVVTVHKPQAPIGLPFADVSVSIRRERRTRAVIALGANLSAPVDRMADAVRRLTETDGVKVEALSPLVETDPVGGPTDQGTYLNAVLIVSTRLAPRTLLGVLQEIEEAHGRTREVRWGPRTLDLDLICCTDHASGAVTVSTEPALTLPHPRAHERAFVLLPWLLADPDDPWAGSAWAELTGNPAVPEPGVLSGEQAGTGTPSQEAASRFGVRPGPSWPVWLGARVIRKTW